MGAQFCTNSEYYNAATLDAKLRYQRERLKTKDEQLQSRGTGVSAARRHKQHMLLQ